MKKNIHSRYLLIVLLLVFNSINTNAQVCGLGTTRDTLDWEYLDFLPNTGSYVAPTAYITLAQSQTQRFTFGTQKVTINHNYSGANDPGDNTTNTGEAGSYGNGADVQFIGNGFVTFTFQNAVQNVKFSVYDIDRAQKVTITALNGILATPITTLAKISGVVLTIAGSGTNTASATAAGSTNVANNSTDGTINVDIAGPVTSFTLTITNTTTNGSEDGSFWVSDVSACSAGTFTNNYYNVSKPYTGQPGYILAARNDTVYYVNPATGAAKFLFADYGNPYMNSMGYDPVRHMLYYTYSLSAGGSISTTDYILRRYDYDQDTLGVFSTDVRNLGIPLYDQSIESGGAAFYDGSFYLGIEGGNSVSDRESDIWKIDLTAGYGPAGLASQVYGIESDTHDWADFGINNGILYDFNGSAAGTHFYHKNILTGSTQQYTPSPSTLVPRQVGIDWTGQVYNIGSPSTIAAGTIVPYNYNGSVNVAQQYNISFLGVNPVGSWGDAAEAFKPKTDFGDAPASYDPAGSDPAVTEKDDSLRLGNTVGIEWSKHTSVDATGDGAEEDGVTNPQVIPTGTSNFLLKVKVYNHTGANATLAGWIDKNGDGLFQAGEGVTATVASSPSLQLVNLLWSAINVTVPALGITFMRLRVTSAANGMTTANPTGYFPNGEVEDYLVNVTIVLPDQNVSLKAQKVNSQNVNLVWNVNDENDITKYELQSSNDGSNWQTINNRTTQGNAIGATYSFLDNDPYTPVSYFRVKVFKNSGETIYSETKRIDFDKENSISVSPNPAKDIAKLDIQAANAGTARISVLDFTGSLVSDEIVKVLQGANSFKLPVVQKLSNGVYKVRVQLNAEILVTTLVVIK